jgi:glucosamine--fructose-6-phosphate aminotransferase (isomerizing)
VCAIQKITVVNLSAHPLTDPIPLAVAFYGMVEQVARTRGINPNQPRGLRKVMETR